MASEGGYIYLPNIESLKSVHQSLHNSVGLERQLLRQT